MTEEPEPDYLDEFVDNLMHLTGGRNLRREAAALRGDYLTRWMDLELNLDELISEYLEVPDHRRRDMTDGFLPLIASVRAKVDFLRIVVERVDSASQAYQLVRQAQELRNKLAHRPANFAAATTEVSAGAIPFVAYRRGVESVVYVTPSEALELVSAAKEAVFQLTLRARPDYLDRMRKRVESWTDAMPSGEE